MTTQEQFIRACVKGDLALVKELYSTGDVDLNWEGTSQMTPLIYACTFEQLPVAKWLYQNGAKIDVFDWATPKLRSYSTMINMGLIMTILMKRIMTAAPSLPLSHKWKPGPEILEYTVLQRAYECAYSHGQLSVVKWICETLNSDNDDYEFGALAFDAAFMGPTNTSIVSWLLETGDLDPNRTIIRGYTPIHLACLHGNVPIAKLLYSTGLIDINAPDRYGETPFQKACGYGYLPLMKWLYSTGEVDINAPDRNGKTPFQEACNREQLPVMKWLYSAGEVNINAPDRNGETPFQKACDREQLPVMEWLYSTGEVDINARFRNGKTPFINACDNAQLSTAKWLIHLGVVPPVGHILRDYYEQAIHAAPIIQQWYKLRMAMRNSYQ